MPSSATPRPPVRPAYHLHYETLLGELGQALLAHGAGSLTRDQLNAADVARLRDGALGLRAACRVAALVGCRVEVRVVPIPAVPEPC